MGDELRVEARHMVYCGTESPVVLVLELMADGSLEEKQVLANNPNPHGQSFGAPGGVGVEWVALHPSGTYLYALSSFWDKARGEAVSYAVDRLSGLLEPHGAPVSTGGHQACHSVFSRDSAGSWLAVAHYLDGVVSILDCRAGALGPEPVCRVELEGERSPMGDHKGPLAHGLAFTPHEGSFLAVCDAGQGQVCVFPFDVSSGQLGPVVCVVSSVSIVPMHGPRQRFFLDRMGIRPRHLAFHPTAPYAYVLTELGSAIAWHPFDGATGELGAVCGFVSSVSPPSHADDESANWASELEVSADGRFLYVSNRGMGAAEESIAVFALDESTGEACRVQSAAANGCPRHFCFFNAGGDLLVGLQKKSELAAYRADSVSGELALRKSSFVGFEVDCVAVLEIAPADPACL